MAQYKTGTVSVTNGSQTVTGSGTAWSTAGLSVGDIFTVANVNATYEVGSIDSDAQITLTANYAGITGSGLTYAITTDFTTTYGIPVPYKGDIEMASIIRRAFTKIDNEFILTSSGGTIDGDLTLTGDLTVQGTIDGGTF